ncbi:hypothetical protein SBRY_10716 [Actinacidiphila bryophytorum]|uniref:Uncharacterized protein n=1 Tax=Actinacidiphila bryophytorum TaxID=1436133 RepID=A0A9W4E3H1_9ACTN|nr:hypothetical protein SBRY_10716 [Actinacidiphila bryophytorum]
MGVPVVQQRQVRQPRQGRRRLEHLQGDRRLRRPHRRRPPRHPRAGLRGHPVDVQGHRQLQGALRRPGQGRRRLERLQPDAGPRRQQRRRQVRPGRPQERRRAVLLPRHRQGEFALRRAAADRRRLERLQLPVLTGVLTAVPAPPVTGR